MDTADCPMTPDCADPPLRPRSRPWYPPPPAPPPAPPPDNVPPIDPDVRGANSIRETIIRHRENPGCFECHRKIDPLGFALENFNPIGAWRTNYIYGRRVGPKIESAGELPDGTPFQDVADLKKILVARQGQFSRMLVGKMLAYACGRRTGDQDRPQIDHILAALAKDQHGLRTLVEQIVLSEAFCSK